MVLDKKIIITAIILIAVFASLDTRPRALILSIATPEDAPLPYNTGPLGASLLAEELEDMGYQVVVLPESGDLTRLLSSSEAMDTRVIVTVIGAESLVNREALLNIWQILSRFAPNRSVSLVYADENPLIDLDNSIDWELLQLNLCGSSRYYLGEPEPAASVLVSLPSGSTIVTGYTAPLIVGSTGGVAYAVEPPKSRDEVFLYAWPSASDVRGLWYSLGGWCTNGDDSLVITGDSTMLLNYTLSQGGAYRELVEELYTRASYEDGGIVVFIQELYISESARTNIAVMLAPSVILLAAAELYARVEPSVSSFISSTILAPAFVASISVFLWSTLSLYSRRVRRIGEHDGGWKA